MNECAVYLCIFFLFDSGYATSGAMPYHSLRPLHLIEVIFVLFRMDFYARQQASQSQ